MVKFSAFMVASVQVLIPWTISGLWIAYKKFPMKVLCATFYGLTQMTAEAGVFLLEELVTHLARTFPRRSIIVMG
jgi:hypothetical protein